MNLFDNWPMAFVGGFSLGLLYFRFLWLTVRRMFVTSRPLRLMIISFAVRLGLALSGFYLIMDGAVERLLFALSGFVVARELGKRLWGKAEVVGPIPEAAKGF